MEVMVSIARGAAHCAVPQPCRKSHSKDCFHRWKNAGRPSSEDPASKAMKSAKKQLRSIQRQASSDKEEKMYNEIMEADERDQKLFHKLIKKEFKILHTN